MIKGRFKGQILWLWRPRAWRRDDAHPEWWVNDEKHKWIVTYTYVTFYALRSFCVYYKLVAAPRRLSHPVSAKVSYHSKYVKNVLVKYSKCWLWSHSNRKKKKKKKPCTSPARWGIFVSSHNVSLTLSVISRWHVSLCTQEVFFWSSRWWPASDWVFF